MSRCAASIAVGRVKQSAQEFVRGAVRRHDVEALLDVVAHDVGNRDRKPRTVSGLHQRAADLQPVESDFVRQV